ncbi:Trehalase [Spraguea lophii 42_110]|uniref:Trehalase n=1 Tax=Spraguea lophii (strain 42_110) TaxID=1358809 RepID=S7XW16_SPRLO|nr:Trehalase [Spraguea lophii 42_110]
MKINKNKNLYFHNKNEIGCKCQHPNKLESLYVKNINFLFRILYFVKIIFYYNSISQMSVLKNINLVWAMNNTNEIHKLNNVPMNISLNSKTDTNYVEDDIKENINKKEYEKYNSEIFTSSDDNVSSNMNIYFKENISFSDQKIVDCVTQFDNYFSVEVIMVLENFRTKKFNNIFIAQLVPKDNEKEFQQKFQQLKEQIKIIINKSLKNAISKNVLTDSIKLKDNSSTMRQMIDFLDCLIPNYSKDGIIGDEIKKLVDEFIEQNFHLPSFYLKNAAIDIVYDLENNKEDEILGGDIQNREIKNMISGLLHRWKDLYKRCNYQRNNYFTLINIKNPFIVPGGIFREYYYWDTYWVLEGLLVSKCYDMAMNVLKNFIDILNALKYIPNGTRKYFYNRSQPPYFISMLKKAYDHDRELFGEIVLGEGLKAAEIEYEFWDKNRTFEVRKNGKKYKATFYRVMTNFLRPESYHHDFMLFCNKHLKKDGESFNFKKFFDDDDSILGERKLFSNIKSACESGWDFSTRWLHDDNDLGSIQILYQIPVDLNSLMYDNEITLSHFYNEKGNGYKNKSELFKNAATRRRKMINDLLWNENKGCWNDYNIKEKNFVEKRFYFSNITPLFYGINKEGVSPYKILKLYQKELFGYVGGVPASGKFNQSIHQWDYPNCWAPHQEMLVTYLLKGLNEKNLALHVASRFFKNAQQAFKLKHSFFEKYSCKEEGKEGGGGEYVIQLGFGWTNGVLLKFIKEFGDKLDGDITERLTERKIDEYLEEKIHKENKIFKY